MQFGKIGRLITCLAMLLSVAACGGGGGGDMTASGGTGGTGIAAVGVMTKGSVIVNGVRFEDTTANILIDDSPKSAAALKDGMVVRVVGTVNDDGISGTAQRVEAQIEARGVVTAVFPAENPQRFVVLNQQVLVDDLTLYSNLAGFGAIVADPAGVTGTLVEVHGLRDSSNRIRATRVEANTAQMGDNTVDEIRGVVAGGAGANPISFTVGTQNVSVTGNLVISPVGASYQNGSVVEVHCSVRPCVVAGIFQASRIEVESAEDANFLPGAGGRLDAEGLVSGFTGHPGNFSVGGIAVTTTGSTRFEGGIATDLANDIKVEAEGSWNGSALVATKIEFKRTVIRLQGFVANVVGQTFDLQIANNNYVVKVELDSLTNGVLPPAGPNCVQVRGQLKNVVSPLTVTAGEIGNCSNSDRHFIQAPVEAESVDTTITLLGFVLNVSSPTDTPPYKDLNDQPLTRTAFFNAVTPATTTGGISRPGTLVKVIFVDGSNTVRQVELED